MASCQHGRVDVQVFVCGLPDTESSRMVALQILTDAEEAMLTAQEEVGKLRLRQLRIPHPNDDFFGALEMEDN